MTYVSRATRAERARALSAALTLGELAGWRFDERPDSPIRGLHNYLYEPVADLILVPWAHGLSAIKQAVRAARCDAVLPAMGKTNDGRNTLYVSVALWSAKEIAWCRSLRLWRGSTRDQLWLVPDPNGEAPEGPCLRLARTRLRGVAARPWKDLAERDAGLVAGDRLIVERLQALPGGGQKE